MTTNYDWMSNPYGGTPNSATPASMTPFSQPQQTAANPYTSSLTDSSVPVGGNANPQTNSWLSMDSVFGGTDANGMQSSGWLAPTIGAATGVANSVIGFQNMQTAKDQLAFQQNAWQEQFDIQKEEFEYQKQRRDERMANYEASRQNL